MLIDVTTSSSASRLQAAITPRLTWPPPYGRPEDDVPKISADTLAEHREEVLSSLLEGTKRILLSERKLTAGSVAAEAGIARNSIYRYVASVDDLIDLVVAHGFADWAAAVATAVADAPDARAGVVAYVRSNLTLAASGEHALQSSHSRANLSDSARRRIVEMHQQISEVLHDTVAELDCRRPDLLIAAIDALVGSALNLVGPDAPAGEVIEFMCGAAAAVVTTATHV